MMLPFGTELAAGALRALARRRRTVDDSRAEAPGKIPHELRRTAYLDPESGLALPPVYYGTVDATALWVTLLGEARHWGLADQEVRALLPHLRAAVDWLTGPGRLDADGFLTYLDTTGAGWPTRDGRTRPTRSGAGTAGSRRHPSRWWRRRRMPWRPFATHLFRALGEDGAEEADKAAADLRGRVAASFWVSTDAGRHLAIALDGNGAPVDGLGSNMGHVLGTGTLSAAESAVVAATVTGEELLDPFGIRTLGTGNGGFNPIGYHTGSIWTHDTAITSGAWPATATPPRPPAARALLASAEAFDYLARALLRPPDDGAARALPGLVPSPGVVRGLRRRAGHRGSRPAPERCGLAPTCCARRPSAPCAWRDCSSGARLQRRRRLRRAVDRERPARRVRGPRRDRLDSDGSPGKDCLHRGSARIDLGSRRSQGAAGRPARPPTRSAHSSSTPSPGPAATSAPTSASSS